MHWKYVVAGVGELSSARQTTLFALAASIIWPEDSHALNGLTTFCTEQIEERLLFNLMDYEPELSFPFVFKTRIQLVLLNFDLFRKQCSQHMRSKNEAIHVIFLFIGKYCL